MYLDLLANHMVVNRKLVKLFGPDAAIYCTLLLEVLNKVREKHTFDDSGFFPLDRAYIERETSLKLAKQLACDVVLADQGILAIDPKDPNRLAIDAKQVSALISEEDPVVIKTKTKRSKAEEKAAKVAGMKTTMKKAIKETDSRVRAAYERWIESMIDSESCRFTKAVVQLFEETVAGYSTDPNVRIDIIELATINNYKNAQYAISRLPGYKSSTGVRPVEQKIGTAVDGTVTF